MKYFSLVGSYEGGVLFAGRWTRAKNLNYIDKRGWERVSGPLAKRHTAVLTQKAWLDFKNKEDRFFCGSKS